MPWLAVPFEDAATRNNCSMKYQIRGIPALILLDGAGSLITAEGRKFLMNDPQGNQFPWGFRKSPDVTHTLNASLEELYLGHTKTLKITRKKRSGNALVDEVVSLEVPIKKGWKSGTKIRYERMGDESLNASVIPSDIVFVVSEKPHERFQRDNSDLRCKVHISLEEALCSDPLTSTVQVKTLDGKHVEVGFPGEEKDNVVRSGDIRVVPGRGMPVKGGEAYGDLHVEFLVDLPEKLPVETKEKIRELLRAL